MYPDGCVSKSGGFGETRRVFEAPPITTLEGGKQPAGGAERDRGPLLGLWGPALPTAARKRGWEKICDLKQASERRRHNATEGV